MNLYQGQRSKYAMALLRGAIVNRTYGLHKTYMFTHFYQQYLVLFTMVPRNKTSISRRRSTIAPGNPPHMVNIDSPERSSASTGTQGAFFPRSTTQKNGREKINGTERRIICSYTRRVSVSDSSTFCQLMLSNLLDTQNMGIQEYRRSIELQTTIGRSRSFRIGSEKNTHTRTHT